MKYIANWLKVLTEHNGQDLSLVDNIFAIFIAISLALAFDGWVKEYIYLGTTIAIWVTAIVVGVMVCVNQKRRLRLWLSYGVTLLIAYLSYEAILDASADDLYPKRFELRALYFGVALWIIARELTVVITNAVEYVRPND